MKGRIGRPPVDNPTAQYSVSLTEKDYDRAKANAAELGLSVSAYLRMLIKVGMRDEIAYELALNDDPGWLMREAALDVEEEA
jgi:hypothetical protein